MAETTKIEWAESTWNPLRGQNARHTCARISPGCDNCYAATMTRRGLMGTAPIDYGVGETPNDPARLDEAALLQPLKWKKPRKVFVCSMTDLFGTWVPDEWIDRIFAVMALTPWHTYIVLTKRPSRMATWFAKGDPLEDRATLVSREAGHIGGVVWDSRGSDEWNYSLVAGMPGRAGSKERAEHLGKRRVWPGWPLPHVWVGVTIESDAYTWRANKLRETPAAVRWISAEPLIGGLPSLDLTGIDWIVTGGESGAKARPMDPQWARDLRDQCLAAGVAFFHKQNGEYVEIGTNRLANLGFSIPTGERFVGATKAYGFEGGSVVQRVGRKLAGRLLDGREHNAYPA